MTLDLKALQADVLRISDLYAREHNIERSGDWALLKVQEELGELTAEHLRMSGRARGAPRCQDVLSTSISSGLGKPWRSQLWMMLAAISSRHCARSVL